MTSALREPESKAATVVARDLCRRIVEGGSQEGDALPSEAELIASYGVSRAVLREALRLLEWDSYISVRRGAGGGAVVMLPDARIPARYCGILLQVLGTTLDDVDDAVRAIEPRVVGAVATRAQAPLEVLERALAQEADDEQSASGFLASGSHFHELLPAALGNPALKVLLDIPREIRIRHNLTTLGDLTGDRAYHRKTISTHRKALQLMSDGDADAARELWARHLAATSEALRKAGERTVLDLFNGRAIDVDLAAPAAGGRRRTRIPKGADIVAGELRRLIVTGAIEEGGSIPTEGALMEHYGLSRPVVREALRILEAEHLVQLVRGAHQGGRARRPTLAAAVWQTGLLMQRLGCTLGEIAEAQCLIEQCASGLLVAGGPGVQGNVFDAILGTRDPEPVTPSGDLDSTLDMFDALNDHVANQTLRALGTIGRTLLRRAVETAGPAGGSGGVTKRPVQTKLSLLRAAGSRSLERLRSAWDEGSARVYHGIAASGVAEERLDMFS